MFKKKKEFESVFLQTESFKEAMASGQYPLAEMSLGYRQDAIEKLKFYIKEKLQAKLNLARISAPHFIEAGRGLQDGLSGVEKAVGFDIPAAGKYVEVPHSLAKWKRDALSKYGYGPGEGIVVDGAYFRREEPVLDNHHSVFVDQWDWELIMKAGERDQTYLRKIVSHIIEAIVEAQDELYKDYPQLRKGDEYAISEKVSFITAQELEEMYPDLTPEQRETRYTIEHPTTFIQGIGEPLKDGKPHSKRAPDYDDHKLNGDLVVYNPMLEQAMELSSMGIRVDDHALLRQYEVLLETGNLEQRGRLRKILDGIFTKAHTQRERDLLQKILEQEYHQKVLDGTYSQTIGGGIGQSRVAMQILGAAHIREVQVSEVSEQVEQEAEDAGLMFL